MGVMDPHAAMVIWVVDGAYTVVSAAPACDCSEKQDMTKIVIILSKT